MHAIVFSLIYLSILFIPGWAYQKLLRIESPNVLLAFSLSYAGFALTFVLSNYFALSANSFAIIIFGELLVCSIYLARHKMLLGGVSVSPAVIGLVVVSAIYQLSVGAFIEVPADLYAHLERYQSALAKLSDNNLGYALSAKQLLLQKSGVFYYLVAFCSSYANISTANLIELVDFLNRTVFIIAIYQFAKIIFKDESHKERIAILAVFFVAAHMGISIIAYIRYYTFAPTILNMVMYFAAATLVLDLLRKQLSLQLIFPYLGLLLITVAASTIHVQEALFIAIIASCIALYVVIHGLIKTQPGLTSSIADYNFRHALIAVLIAAAAFTSAYIYSHLNLERALNAHWRLWEFGQGFGLIPDISTLNLKNQFAQVLTLWGILVYVLFFINIKRYRNNVFILAAMLSPILTILNPFFIDLFLRHYNSTTVWRFCYLIPVHFVGADLFLLYVRRLKSHTGVQRIIPAILVLLLIVLLTPMANTWNKVHFSKAPTLMQSEAQLSHKRYAALVGYLNSLEKKETILTDPVMGYMVSALTKHHSQRRKFFRDRRFRDFTFSDYDNQPLSRYKGKLIIVNTRDIPLSEVGRLSKHWSADQWHSSHYYYTDALLRNLSSQPTRFEQMWASADHKVIVYRIR